MTDIVLVVAQTLGGLQAVADSNSLQLLPGTARQFSGLETFSEPVMTSVGILRTGKSGFIAFAIDSDAVAPPALA
jgi:hypothetical protein